MLFVDKLNDKEIDFGKVIRQALIHDWKELVLGDLPAGSPSFASFWGINIREEAEKAGEKAMGEMWKFIEEEIDTNLYKTNLTGKEKLVLKAADLTAYLLEMQEWKYLGYKHDGWEMIWFNTVAIVEKIDLPFIPDLVREIKETYQRGSKKPSPFLAKGNKQTNPEHKL
jgi:5'-deoxynucleotidase YfbR-like HD superfamily hydrolase